MLRRTVSAVAVLVAFGVAISAWAADDSFSFVIEDRAGSIAEYAWLEPVPEALFADVAAAEALSESGELTRLSTPESRFILFRSRSCPPLIEIAADPDGAVRVTARNPRVDWRCGGYQHTYVLELRLNPNARRDAATVIDGQTSEGAARP